jgi:hypothetical protein
MYRKATMEKELNFAGLGAGFGPWGYHWEFEWTQEGLARDGTA